MMKTKIAVTPDAGKPLCSRVECLAPCAGCFENPDNGFLNCERFDTPRHLDDGNEGDPVRVPRRRYQRLIATQTSQDEQALACLVNDAPDSALSVFEDGASIAIVLRHAPESVRMAVVRFAQGLLADPESLQVPTGLPPVVRRPSAPRPLINTSPVKPTLALDRRQIAAPSRGLADTVSHPPAGFPQSSDK